MTNEEALSAFDKTSQEIDELYNDLFLKGLSVTAVYHYCKQYGVIDSIAKKNGVALDWDEIDKKYENKVTDADIYVCSELHKRKTASSGLPDWAVKEMFSPADKKAEIMPKIKTKEEEILEWEIW